MDITSWPGGEQKKNTLSFVGDELSFMKLGSCNSVSLC